MSLTVGILTISDRVSKGQMDDRGGPAIEKALAKLDVHIRGRLVVPDERAKIALVLREWADGDRLNVIFTTGGTGLGPRDVTPEATMDVCDRLVPGIAEAMRSAGLAQTPYSMISRALAGTRGSTLIINLPGSPKGAAEGVQVVMPILEHAVEIIGGGKHG